MGWPGWDGGLDFMDATFALGCVGALLALAVFAALPPRTPAAATIVYLASTAICAALCAGAVAFLLGAPSPSSAELPLGVPWIGARFRVDHLSAFFLAVVNLGGTMASLYAVGYGRHEESPGRVLPFYPAFLAGMNLVVLADDAFTFLVAWEFMSLSSWALVMAYHENPENRRAGFIYIVMASLGTLALLLAFGLLAGPDGAYGFTEMRDAARADWVTGLVLALVLLGAGSKAGLVPLHVWLPLAHPAAPNHVSALMSGVMTKVAIYGFIRIVFDLLGSPAWWWGAVVLVLGGVTAVLGVLFAILERDLKRLLAYSTVENVGIIFIGLGLALAFQANGMAAAAALAFTAALFHVLNHALFKSLLFFGAGAVLNATGTRDIEKLGGLIHVMPWTAAAFLGGSLAIAALPPMNGFVSEWLIFQAILLSPELPQWGLKLLVPAVGAMLALAAALAAACYVRAFGIAFLGRARSPEAAAARETDRWSLAAMLALLVLCLAAGILPGFVIDWLGPVARDIVEQAMPEQGSLSWLSVVPVTASRNAYNGLVVFLFIALAMLLTALVIHRFASRAVRRGPAWDCGHPYPVPAGQYSGNSFAQPLRRVFGDVFRAADRVDMPPPGDARPARLDVTTRDLVWDGIYAPVAALTSAATGALDRVQFLTVRQSLGLMFAALVGLLVVVAIWM